MDGMASPDEMTPPTPVLARDLSLDATEFDELPPFPAPPYSHATHQPPEFLGEKSPLVVEPFMRLYTTPQGTGTVFTPHTPLTVKITQFERTQGSSKATSLLSPYLYTIVVEHGDFRWTIKRRYKHVQSLHKELQLFRASLAIPLPTKTHRDKRSSMKNYVKREKDVCGNPRFPKRPEALVPLDLMDDRMRQLESYLQAVLRHELYRQHPETLRFLEVSPISFVGALGQKLKEGVVSKRAGDEQTGCCILDSPSGCCSIRLTQCCIPCCGPSCSRWMKRWLFLKDTWLGYLHPKTNQLRCVLLMDHAFQVSTGLAATGVRHGVLVSNSSRRLLITAWTRRQAKEWVASIQEVAKASEFVQQHPFGSFAPVRSSTQATWFVDGSSYMDAVANALEMAQQEIFIADWWLSPEIYMKRPIIEGDKWRLDRILRRKAESGVRVYVLLYKEVELALGINSMHSKQQLTKQHPNIKVLRHPDHVAGGVLFWAHHEKMVVVDQTYAFQGGIDLCYGRWDDYKHRLVDTGSITKPTAVRHVLASHTVGQNVPSVLLQLAKSAQGVSFSAVCPKDVAELHEVRPEQNGHTMTTSLDTEEEVEEEEEAEDDVEVVDEYIKGDTPPVSRRATVLARVKNYGHGWMEKWHRSVSTDPEAEKELPADHKAADQVPPAEDNPDCAIVVKEIIASDLKMAPKNIDADISKFHGSAKLWIGKDYTNFIVKDFSNLDKPFQDSVDRNNIPRMPWHDIGSLVYGHAARDLARHFIQRWNAVKTEKMKDDDSFPFLVPKSYRTTEKLALLSDLPSSRVQCQALRSASQWSAKLRHNYVEDSIQRAYIRAISEAKHYIYIENQFFITLAGPSSGNDVSNSIGRALKDRILRAHREGTRFRVYVVMPLLPGFEGQFGTTKGTAIQAITHWNYASICRGSKSLMQQLNEENVEASQYISFYGLRKHAELHGQLVTELIYVHSKLMIVDDRVVVCGSANINDRSMSGHRDSELALRIQDEEFEDSVMDGQPYKAGKFAGSLRRFLFKEHLGLLEAGSPATIDIVDPVCDAFYKRMWIRIASRNTSTFEKVFSCLPTDLVQSFAELKSYQSGLPLATTDTKTAKQMLANVQGHLVLLPLYFLCKEDLTPAAGTAEALMPTSLWT